MVYLAGKAAAQTWQVAWLESSGKLQPVITAPGAYAYPRLSPDGRKLAFDNGTDIIYVHDLERDTETRLTFTGGSRVPVWTPDGKHIAFRSDGSSIFWIRSDGAGEPQRLLESRNVVVPWSFSPDGRHLAYVEISPETGSDIGILPLDTTDPDRPKPGKPEPFLRTPADETIPGFSPDGRWIAYRSNESGINEIYVRPFPASVAGKWQISTGGGRFPIWGTHGKEIFYLTPQSRLMAVSLKLGAGSVEASAPHELFALPAGEHSLFPYDVTADGQRFLVATAPSQSPDPLSVIANWPALLKRGSAAP